MTVKLSKSKVYRSKEPVKIGLNELSEKEKYHFNVLTEKKGAGMKEAWPRKEFF